MVSRLVAVDESNNLPVEVAEQLTAPLWDEFEGLANAASTSASNAAASASTSQTAATSANQAKTDAQLAAAQATSVVTDGLDPAAAALVNTTGSDLQVALSSKYAPLVGPNHAVFLGSSNVTPGQWTTQLCSDYGWTEHNYAVGGAAYHPSADSFSVQADRAIADTAYDHNLVGFVFVADASNDVRARVDTMAVQSQIVYSKLRTGFPNARVIVLPVLWPSTPSAFASQVPGGYQVDWNEWLQKDVDAMRINARANRCELIEDSWTWHTGHDEWMKPGEVHFNTAGVAQTTQRVKMYLRGEPTASRTAWTGVAPKAPQYTTTPGGGIKPLSVRRDGWTVKIDGGVRTTAATGTSWDWFTVPNEFRPTYSVEVLGRMNQSTVAVPIEIFPNGTGRVHATDQVATTLLLVTGTYEIG